MAERMTVVARKTPITLKARFSALLIEGKIGARRLVLSDKDVVRLLKTSIEQEGRITGFAKRYGIDRGYLSKVLDGKRPLSSPLVRELGLQRMYAPPQASA